MLFFHSITVTQHCHCACIHATWASLTHSIANGLSRPISSSLSILSPFSFLGHPQSIPILHSHGFLLTLLGFPDLITISFILGVHGLSINPLLTYFITLGLFWPILTFLLPMSLLFLSLGSFRPASFLRGTFIILWAYDLLFLPFGINGFSLNLITLFCPYCWVSSCYWAFPKWASTTQKYCLKIIKNLVNRCPLTLWYLLIDHFKKILIYYFLENIKSRKRISHFFLFL